MVFCIKINKFCRLVSNNGRFSKILDTVLDFIKIKVKFPRVSNIFFRIICFLYNSLIITKCNNNKVNTVFGARAPKSHYNPWVTIRRGGGLRFPH